MKAVDPHYLTWCRGLGEAARASLQPNDAAARLTTGEFLKISHPTKFDIADNAAFFCIGSCFAINVSRALVTQGVNVLSWGFDHPRGIPLLSKFNTYSMLTEIEVALLGRQLPDRGLVEMSEGQFWDPQLHHGEIGSLEAVEHVRLRVNDYFRRLADADVCVITLGLTEMFWDVVTDIPLNGGPVDWKHAKRTGRFEFRNPGFEEVSRNVNRLCEIIHEVTKGRAKVLLTVSPVPLQRTFAEKDIIVANNYSKATLRSAAEEAVRKFEYVDYFPAYEMVTLSPRSISWEHDQQHVKQELVDHVIRTFRQCYMDAE